MYHKMNRKLGLRLTFTRFSDPTSILQYNNADLLVIIGSQISRNDEVNIQLLSWTKFLLEQPLFMS